MEMALVDGGEAGQGTAGTPEDLGDGEAGHDRAGQHRDQIFDTGGAQDLGQVFVGLALAVAHLPIQAQDGVFAGLEGM